MRPLPTSSHQSGLAARLPLCRMPYAALLHQLTAVSSLRQYETVLA
jgi:hypothetical protein